MGLVGDVCQGLKLAIEVVLLGAMAASLDMV